MKKLGDQWIEIIDGQGHMVKAVEKFSEKSYDCTGCIFNGHKGTCLYHSQDCPLGEVEHGYIKDLGVLNKDGLLPPPSDKNVYPELYQTAHEWEVCASSCGVSMTAVGSTKQQAKDAWNRRA